MIITHNGTILKHDGTILTKITEVPPQPPSFINTYSLDFDGVDDNVYLQNLTSRKVQTLTMSVWVKPTANARDGIVLNGNTSYGNEGIRIDWVFNTFKTKINGVFYELGPGNGQNNWTHIAIAYDGNTLKRMTNGVQFSDVFVGATINYTNYNGLHLGRSTSGFHIGNIDEFAFWDSDQSANFSTIYNNGIPNNLSSLNPLSWYRMGENGSYKSPQWLIPSNENKDKVSNYSLDFDGVDDYVDVGTSLNLGTDSTISFWVKRGRVNTDEMFLGENTYLFDYLIFVTSSNTIYIRINTVFLEFTGTSVTSVMNDTTNWINIVAVRSGDSIELFLNGNSVGTQSGYGALIDTRFDTIAAKPSGGFPFMGNIDELAAWDNNTINPLDIYNGGTPTTLPSGAVAHYKMGEEANFTSNWLVDNSALTNYSKRSFEFDGVDDYVDLGSSSTVADGGQFSLSFWIKGTSQSAGAKYLFSADYYNLNTYWTIQNTELYWRDINNVYKLLSTNLLDGEWHHILIIWNPDGANSTIRCFTDGVNEVNIATDFRYAPGWNGGAYQGGLQYIGNRGGGTFSGFNGSIDEFAVWDNDQSSNVLDIYNGGEPTTIIGAVAHYKMGEDASFDGTNWTVPDNVGSNDGTS
jgi:hypothetical protein